MAHATQLLLPESVLLVVDVQEKLTAKIPAASELVRNLVFLVDAAKFLGVPTLATEQYPRGLGPTVAPLAERIANRPDKIAFSSCAVPSLVEGLQKQGRTRVVLTGIETHVCILNTALDLLDAGFKVYLPIDAVASRFAIDHETALRRMERAGVILTTCEATVFEWLGGAGHPQFKPISLLVQERMKQLR